MIFLPTRDGQALGLGGAPLGNLFAPLAEAAADGLLESVLAAGCGSFDTAPHYGNGLSEHRMGRALRTVPREAFVLSTKVGRLLHPRADAPRAQNSYENVLPFVQCWDFSSAGVRRSVEDSLQRMGLAQLDVVYIHDCDAGVHGAKAYPRILHQVVHEALPELRRLRDEGLLRYIGLGVNDVQVCLDVLHQTELDCLMLAGRYSLIDHTALADLLPLCAARGERLALGGAFNSGILATGVRGARQAGQSVRFNYAPAAAHWVERVATIEAVCERHAVPLRAAALQFPLAHPAVEMVVLGVTEAAHWQDARQMVAHTIPQAFWAELRAQGLLPEVAPVPESAPRSTRTSTSGKWHSATMAGSRQR